MHSSILAPSTTMNSLETKVSCHNRSIGPLLLPKKHSSIFSSCTDTACKIEISHKSRCLQPYAEAPYTGGVVTCILLEASSTTCLDTKKIKEYHHRTLLPADYNNMCFSIRFMAFCCLHISQAVERWSERNILKELRLCYHRSKEV